MKRSVGRRSWGMVCASLLAASAIGLGRHGMASESTAATRGKPLFNGTDLAGWTAFVDPDARNPPGKPWSVKDGMIVCEGSVRGYLATVQSYENFALRVDWRWGEKVTRPGRYSSVFVNVTGPDRIWPKGLDVTLGADAAGEFFLVRGYELDVDRRLRDPKAATHYFAAVPHADRPIGEWNHVEITSNRGKVRVRMNGRLVNEGTAANPDKGRIILLSEGAEIYFRNLEITPLPAN